MPEIERPDGTLVAYEVGGSGPPLLLLAPGIVNSAIESWGRAPFDPRTRLADAFSVIAMDQRYAGRSTGSSLPFSYETMAQDQLAVLDAVGARSALVLGWGIGATYALRLIHDAPERIAAAVLAEPPGRDATNSRHDFYTLFYETVRLARDLGLEAVVEAASRNPSFDENPAAGPYAQRLVDPGFAKELLEKGRERYAVRVVRFRDGIWPDDTPFFSVPESWVPECPAPLLVLPGRDRLHPAELAVRIAAEAPRGRLLDADNGSSETLAGIGTFLLDSLRASPGS